MSNRIKNILISTLRVDPIEADIGIHVVPDTLFSDTQVRARFVGPACLYSSTVEVAYSVREHSRDYDPTGIPHLKVPGIPHITLRAIIPEPCLWDPESPFLYRGTFELCQGDKLVDRQTLDYGIRRVQLGPKELTCNGRPIILHGLEWKDYSSEQARALHQAGFNTLLVPALEESGWDLADRFGFLVLGRIQDPLDVAKSKNQKKHASNLGWVLNEELLNHPIIQATGVSFLGQLVGVELRQPLDQPLPPGFSFILCKKGLLGLFSDIDLPKLIISEVGERPSKGVSSLGWIDPQ